MKCLIIICLFTSVHIFAQRVFITQNSSEADFKIFVSKDKFRTDWIVMKTEWKNQARNGRWYFTEWKNEADIIIYIVNKKYDADKVIYFTEWTTSIKFPKTE